MREGRGNCLNTLKEDGTELRGGDTKIILGEEAESRGGYYKREAGTLLQTMTLVT